MPNVDEMWAGAREAATVRRVFGEPYEQDGITVIPVAAVRGAAGGGGDANHNGGGGFALQGRPVGVYVIHEGDVSWRPAVDPNRIMRGWQIIGGLIVLGIWSTGRRLTRR